MKIKLIPILSDQKPPQVYVNENTVRINDEAFDFSELPNGYSLPSSAVGSDWFTGEIERSESGEITVSLILPHGDDAAENVRFPESLEVEDGWVPLPKSEPKKEHLEND